MTEESSSDKNRRIQHIRNLFAFDLFSQHRFQESLKIFAELGTGENFVTLYLEILLALNLHLNNRFCCVEMR